MANDKISDLTAGSPPYDGLTLLELSVPTGSSPPYASRKGNLADILAASVTTGISAAGSTQGGATALTTVWNAISTAGAGTGVRLQTSPEVGINYIVYNGGANPVLVYPPTGAAIDDAGTNVGVLVGTNTLAEFRCFTSTQFYSK